MNAQTAFTAAVAAFKAGRLGEAAELAGALVRELPGNPVCLHLLGVIEHKAGRAEVAEGLLRRSVAIEPKSAEAQYNLAQTLMTLRRPEEAAATYRAALDLQAGYAPAQYGLGHALRQLGDKAGAEAAYRATVELLPNDAEALNSLGTLLCELQKFAEGYEVLLRALAQRPNSYEILNNLAVSCQESRRYDEAADYAEQALALKPDYVPSLNNLGNARRSQGRYGDAIDLYQQVIARDADVLEATNNMGLCLMDAAFDLDGAEACFRHVLAKKPDHAQALNNLGIVLCHKGRLDEGADCYRRALALDPNYAHALNNLGNALRNLGDTKAALAIYRRVVALMPDYGEAHNNLAMALLVLGEFEEGWREYEWRWETDQLAPARRGFTQPQWRGEPGHGETLLLHAEQGFGDTIQFCRYAPLAAAKGFRVVLEVQPALVRLMGCLPGVAQVVAQEREPLPPFDLHCPLMSLPAIFGTPIKAEEGAAYLSVPAGEVERFGRLIDTYRHPRAGGHDDTKLRVGLVWAGSARKQSPALISANRRRSMDAELLAPLFTVAGVEFYSLQKLGPKPPEGFPLIDLMPECRDFADTAALIMNLDLVISVDTAVAHLAAALGKPVWLLNRFDTCWRWLLEREECGWYSTLRQFRQQAPEDWAPVVDRVKEALEKLAKEGRKPA